MVVAQLVELPLPNQRSAVQIQSSAKKLFRTYLYSVNCIEKTKKKKRPGMAHFIKNLEYARSFLCKIFYLFNTETLKTNK